MASKTTNRTVHCACGSVELATIGEPIISAVCYCDDCQAAAVQLEELPNAPPVLDGIGGTEFLLYRKDRMDCIKGSEHLENHRLTEASTTKRVVASCCSTYLFLDFQKGHWFSMHRARFDGPTPAPKMRIQTKSKPEGAVLPDDVPAYPTFPMKFLAILVMARLKMFIS